MTSPWTMGHDPGPARNPTPEEPEPDCRHCKWADSDDGERYCSRPGGCWAEEDDDG